MRKDQSHQPFDAGLEDPADDHEIAKPTEANVAILKRVA